MMEEERESYKYYAFISYSHKDQKIARKLQKSLESYHLPSALQKANPELPKKLTPVFLDESDLVSIGSLDESLKKIWTAQTISLSFVLLTARNQNMLMRKSVTSLRPAGRIILSR